MDYNDTYEREIDLKELAFAVLHKWKMILVFAVALALLLGGYKGISTYRTQNNEEVLKAARESYAREMEIYNKGMDSCKREIDNLTRDIAGQQEYVENSILMNMSPYDIWEAKAELFVKSDGTLESPNGDLTPTIMRAYQSVLTSGELLSQLAADMGVDDRYIQELVTITIGWDNYNRNEGMFSLENKSSGFAIHNRQDNHYIMQEDDLLTIQVRHESEDEARELLQGILDGINRFQDQITASIGPHTIYQVNSSVSSKVDLTLADQQNDERTRLDRLKESLEKRTDEMNKLKSPEGMASPVASGIKYGLIGGVLGAFIVVFFVCIGFVMSEKVYSAKELKYRFKVKILGTLPAETKNAGKVDQWLNRLEGRTYKVKDEDVFNLISANIRNYTDGMHALLVIGSALDGKVDKVASELSDRLSDVKVVLGGNILNNVEALRKLPECDGIVLVEQCGESLYSEVELELEKVCDLRKTVVGCVVFE